MNKKLTKKQYFTKIVLLFISVFISSFGCALLILGQLGSDPMSVWVEGLGKILNVSLGTASLINNVVLLVLAAILAFKNLNVGTVISSLFFSVGLSFWEPIAKNILGTEPTLLYRGIITFAGVLIIACACGLTVCLRLGFGACDSILFAASEKRGWPYRYLKIGADGLFALAGFLTGGVVGVGSIFSMLVTGPLIEVCAKFYDKTLLKTLDIQDERNQFKKEEKETLPQPL